MFLGEILVGVAVELCNKRIGSACVVNLANGIPLGLEGLAVSTPRCVKFYYDVFLSSNNLGPENS